MAADGEMSAFFHSVSVKGSPPSGQDSLLLDMRLAASVFRRNARTGKLHEAAERLQQRGELSLERAGRIAGAAGVRVPVDGTVTSWLCFSAIRKARLRLMEALASEGDFYSAIAECDKLAAAAEKLRESKVLPEAMSAYYYGKSYEKSQSWEAAVSHMARACALLLQIGEIDRALGIGKEIVGIYSNSGRNELAAENCTQLAKVAKENGRQAEAASFYNMASGCTADRNKAELYAALANSCSRGARDNHL